MNIAEHHVEALKAFGYTDAEARFLYIVVTHSGYFTAHQFLTFVDAKRGYRTFSFAQKLLTQGHASMREYLRNGCIYHLYSRKLYAQLDRENLRNRRRHCLEFIKTRLLILDFILANQEHQYLETEPEKVGFFCDQLKIEKQYLPIKVYEGGPGSQPTARYFVDKFPLFFSSPSPSAPPVITFSYVDLGQANLTGFVAHLAAYQALFRQLPQFRFLHISRTPAHFKKATEHFTSVVKIPLESDVSAEVLRYFKVRSVWDTKEFRTLTNNDLLFLNESRRRFHGERFENLFRNWKAGRLTEADIRSEFAQTVPNRKVFFAPYLVNGQRFIKREDDESA